jgi:hypothetical protein
LGDSAAFDWATVLHLTIEKFLKTLIFNENNQFTHITSAARNLGTFRLGWRIDTALQW